MFSFKQFKVFALAALCASVTATATAQKSSAFTANDATTVILVHGAFADGASWNGVASRLLGRGVRVINFANPLRSLSTDANYLGKLIDSAGGQVVLVGHSYGGAVISNAAKGRKNVKALVYVAAFIPDAGEAALPLSGKFPGSTLGQALAPPVMLDDGGKDLYIQQDKFHQQFAADLPKATAELMAAAQRPIAEAALTQVSGAPAWKDLPSYSIFGTEDKNIPLEAMRFMSARAKAVKVIELKGASHVVLVSHPDKVAALIIEAAGLRVPKNQ
jgi:pimeloyl-ACP methyl ester carboxylesterase